MKKKVISLSAAALMTVGLVGCGANDNNFDTQNDGEIRMLERGTPYDNRNLDRDRDDMDVNEGPLTEMMDNDNDRELFNNNDTDDRYDTNTRYRTNRDDLDLRGTTPDNNAPTGNRPGMGNGTEGSR